MSSLTIHFGTQTQTISQKDLENPPLGRAGVIAKYFRDLKPEAILGLKQGETGQIIDLQTSIPKEWKDVQLVSWGEADGLEILRHSMAHVLAQAVKRLYGDKVQVTIGPVIEDGFYYDFKVDKPFTPDDLPKIEKEMKKVLQQRLSVVRQEVSRPQAITFFKKCGEHFKVKIIEDLPSDVVISMYEQGDFTDLCRGPHVTNTGLGNIGFGLTGVSSAYWRGDPHNESLSRIYGTAFFTPQEYAAYIHLKEEAKKRDHRLLGASMDLFSFHQESPGQVLWHPKGVQIRKTLQELIRTKLDQLGYVEIETPQVLSDVLWKQSGHYDHYKENMFFCEWERASESQSHIRYGIKPMNCPGAALFFNSKKRSYRELPLRVSEFGRVFRYEPSGVLHGLLRVRGFVQDDAHIFCRLSHIQQEALALVNLVKEMYALFQFSPPQFVLSTRPKNATGDPKIWDQAEKTLRTVLDQVGGKYRVAAGEGAFYGPKIDFNFKDAIGRVWQLGTIQMDFFLPERFRCEVINEKSESEPVVVIHRAVFGSLERFLGVCIEHFAGKFPVWLAPTQVKLIPISDQFVEYLDTEVVPALESKGVRFEKDYRNEKIGYKIRENQMTKVPYLIIVGQKECDSKTVSIRDYQGQEKAEVALSSFLQENIWSVHDLLHRR